jgi:hypothetical protein
VKRLWLIVLSLTAAACTPDAALQEPRIGAYRLVAINGVSLDRTTNRALTLHNGLRVWTGSIDVRADHAFSESTWLCIDHSQGGSCAASMYAEGAWTVIGNGALRFTNGTAIKQGTFVGDTITVLWPMDTLRYEYPF